MIHIDYEVLHADLNSFLIKLKALHNEHLDNMLCERVSNFKYLNSIIAEISLIGEIAY